MSFPKFTEREKFMDDEDLAFLSGLIMGAFVGLYIAAIVLAAG